MWTVGADHAGSGCPARGSEPQAQLNCLSLRKWQKIVPVSVTPTCTHTVYAESRNQLAQSHLSLLLPSAIKHISPSSAPHRLCSYLPILYVSFCSCSPTSSLLYLHCHSLACFISTPADWPPSTTCYTHQESLTRRDIQLVHMLNINPFFAVTQNFVSENPERSRFVQIQAAI